MYLGRLNPKGDLSGLLFLANFIYICITNQITR